jgi:hypothetical protein
MNYKTVRMIKKLWDGQGMFHAWGNETCIHNFEQETSGDRTTRELKHRLDAAGSTDSHML